ncbi:hypothetical protein Tco_0299625 [Tanacetum coccineum]
MDVHLLWSITRSYPPLVTGCHRCARNHALTLDLDTFASLVQNKQFSDMTKKDPHCSTSLFNKITSTMKFPNVPSTSIKHMLFPIFPSDSLNFAAGGKFLDKMPRDCLRIIKSKSKVLNSRNKLVVPKVSSSSSTLGFSPDVAELKDMVKALLLEKKNQTQTPAPVKAVEESCVTCGGAHSYQNCPSTDGNVYHDNIQEYVSQAAAANFNQGNTGYRAPIANQIRPPVPQTQGMTKNDFESYVKANDAVMRNMQDQNQNLQNQMTNLMDMLSKFVNSNSASTSGSGTLPSNTITNPKVDLKGITTRSGVAYQGPTIYATFSPPKVVERETEVTQETVPPTNNGSTKDV